MKKVLKRILAIVLCVSVFCFPMAFSYASSSSLLPANVVTWDDVSADGKALAEAYVNLIQSAVNGDFKNYFKSLTDVPLKYFKLLSDGTWVLNPVENIYYYLKDGELYIHEEGHGGGGGTRPGEEDSGHGGGGGDRPATSSDIYIPSEDLVDHIDEQNTQYTPKNVLGKMSYRTDERFHNCRPDFEYGYNAIDLYCGKFVATGEEQDIYIMFFAVSSDNSYLGQYQFHFMIRPNEVEHWYEDRDEFMCYGNSLTVEYWDMVNGSQETSVSFVACEDFIDPYIVLDLRDGDFVFFNDLSMYSSYECFKHSFHNNFDFVPPDLLSSYCTLYDVSCSLTTTLDGLVFKSHYKNDPTSHSSSCEYGAGCDFGYVASTTPISTTYNVDTTKIPANQIINITGDTIYDYSITNPDTGASTTINEYVTNNYIYPEAPSTSEPAGGDVTVGGNITVGGEVGVDITVSVPDIIINVNQGSGAGGNGTGINPDDILDGSSVDLDKYYDDAVSQASGVRSFLKQFFDFLPAELVALLALLISVAIVCRIFGR